MRKDLNIGEAARHLGIQPDTLRRLEREGLIRARRTPGGHRRFTEEAIAQYRREKSSPRLAAPSNPPAEVSLLVDGPTDEPDFDRPPRLPQPAPRRPVASIWAPPKTDDQARLTGIKQLAISGIPWDVPAPWRARVIADLEDFVTPRQFPPHLGPWEASRIARGRVEEVIAPYREQQAAEKARKAADQKAEWRIVELRRHGVNYATRETMSWERSEQWAARQAATKELDVKVRAEMSERDVERMVDDVLSDWEEEEADRG